MSVHSWLLTRGSIVPENGFVNSRAVYATDSRVDVYHENELGPSLKTTLDYLESELFGRSFVVGSGAVFGGRVSISLWRSRCR